jgi:multidrug resistance protein MdtO
LLLMPLMTSLGDLFLLLAPVTLLAAWIGWSDRIAYAGMQIGLAFYLVVLHGTGPTIDMDTARDRVIGILLGNIVIFVVFTTIWPVSVTNVVRANVVKALEQLAALVGLGGGGEISETARSAANMAFGQAIRQARAALINDPFETSQIRRAAARRPIDATVVAQIGRLFIPVSMILDPIASPAWRDLPQSKRDATSAYFTALAEWFRQAASWVRDGEGAAEVAHGPPQPPPLCGQNDRIIALATWRSVLDQDLRKILTEISVQPEPAVTPPVGDAFRAAG